MGVSNSSWQSVSTTTINLNPCFVIHHAEDLEGDYENEGESMRGAQQQVSVYGGGIEGNPEHVGKLHVFCEERDFIAAYCIC